MSQWTTWGSLGIDQIPQTNSLNFVFGIRSRISRKFTYGFSLCQGGSHGRISRKFTTGVHPKHKKWVSRTDMSAVFQFSMNPLTEFPGTSVMGFTSDRGDSIDKKSKPWFWIPRRETTPDGKGRYSQTVGHVLQQCHFFKISKSENWNVGICLGAFSTYPKIQISGKNDFSKMSIIYIKSVKVCPKSARICQSPVRCVSNLISVWCRIDP